MGDQLDAPGRPARPQHIGASGRQCDQRVCVDLALGNTFTDKVLGHHQRHARYSRVGEVIVQTWVVLDVQHSRLLRGRRRA
jgi:hypothetical protein